jgi:hypothetical protein
MNYINDLSDKHIIELVNGDETKGADVLTSLAHEKEENNEIIEKLESDLIKAKKRNTDLISASQCVLNNLKKETPIAVIKDKYIIVITNGNISIERNVL